MPKPGRLTTVRRPSDEQVGLGYLGACITAVLIIGLSVVASGKLTASGRGTALLRLHAATTPPISDFRAPLPGFAPPTHPSLTADLPTLMRFVSDTRQLRYLRPVTVTQLGDADFDKAAGAGPVVPDPAHDMGALYQTLGIIANGPGYDAAPNDTSDVDGFYLDGKNRVVLRSGPDTPLMRSIAVHELTHALDDQHFPLDAVQQRVPQTFDGTNGVLGLIEGDAKRVEDDYVGNLDVADKAAYDEESAAKGSGGPDAASGNNDLRPRGRPLLTPASSSEVLEDISYFPYQYGPDYVRYIEDNAGEKSVDKAFAHPPGNSVSVLDTLVPSLPSPTVLAPAAPPGTTVIDRDTLGDFGIYAALERTTLDNEDASAAADTWNGDAAIVWHRDNYGDCLEWHIRVLRTADVGILGRALALIAPHGLRHDVVNDADGLGVTLTNCV